MVKSQLKQAYRLGGTDTITVSVSNLCIYLAFSVFPASRLNRCESQNSSICVFVYSINTIL